MSRAWPVRRVVIGLLLAVAVPTSLLALSRSVPVSQGANPAAQRLEMIKLLRSIDEQMRGIRKSLDGYRSQNGEIPNRRCNIKITDMLVNTTRLSQPNQVANTDG